MKPVRVSVAHHVFWVVHIILYLLAGADAELRAAVEYRAGKLKQSDTPHRTNKDIIKKPNRHRHSKLTLTTRPWSHSALTTRPWSHSGSHHHGTALALGPPSALELLPDRSNLLKDQIPFNNGRSQDEVHIKLKERNVDLKSWSGRPHKPLRPMSTTRTTRAAVNESTTTNGSKTPKRQTSKPNPQGQNPIVKAKEGKGYECRGMTNFIYEARKSFPTETIPQFEGAHRKKSIVIDNKTSCNQTSYVNVSTVTVLNVTVETCCITHCNHTIEVTVNKNEHILLNFLKFNVPGLNLLRSEAFGVCDESLEVAVNIPPKKQSQKLINHVIGRFCGIKAPTAVFVEYSKVNLTLSLLDNKQCVDKINFEVEIVPCLKFDYNSCDSSEYVSLNSDRGYISSPGMSKGQNYPNELECKWTITVPESKLIRLNAELIRLRSGDVIEIYTNRTHSQMFPERLRFTDFNFRHPVVLPGNTCIMKFHSDSIQSGVGFNISYTAVDPSQFIPMFENNSLDCSKVMSLPQEIKCNFYTDCANQEDESNCDHQMEGCWPQGYAFNGNCYQVFINQRHMSWTMAEELCERNLSAHLVTINTAAEKDFLVKLRQYIGSNVSIIFLGLQRMRIQQVKQVYRRMWQWTDGSTAFYLPDEYRYAGWSTCSLLHFDYFHSTECGAIQDNVSFICERKINDNGFNINSSRKQPSVLPSSKFNMFKCQSGEYISAEQQCDKVDNCFDHSDEQECDYLSLADTMFECEASGLLPYSFVCDGIDGCPDSSDEALCKEPDKASLGLTMTVCTDGMTLERSRICDGLEDCLDGSDEEDCTDCAPGSSLCPMIACLPEKWTTDKEIDCPIRDLKGRRAPESEFRENVFLSKPPRGVVVPDGYGKFDIKDMDNDTDPCPETHVQCKDGYCIPLYMWCNDYIDCPYGEDEDWEACELQCKGMYKCKYSRVCVHADQLCDGYYHCPNHDDEILCAYQNRSCPVNCSCTRMELTCTSVPKFDSIVPEPVHYLRLNNAYFPDLYFEGIASYGLIYLNVSSCNVRTILDENLKYLNLRILDVSNNLITSLGTDTFKNCPVLQTLILTNNKMHNTNFSFLQNTRELIKLDLSYNRKDELEDRCFRGASNLQDLTLRFMNIVKISELAFEGLVELKKIDLKGNMLIYFTSKIFLSQKNLRHISTDNFRLCCDFVKPSTVQHTDCEAPYDEISSCADILRTQLLRAALWIMAVLTIVGNLSVIIYRVFFDRGMKYSFRIIITCLSASDLIMGIYLVIIGTADAMFRDKYFLVEREWTSSVSCQVAGFLCLLSSETSALFILLVTIDRLLAIAFPLHPHFHFNGKSASVACGLVWGIGLWMAIVPLLPPFQHWQLYTQKAVGVPLPITRSYFPGYDYAFAILILFNMVVFLMVALGQLLIYLSVRLQKHPQISEIRVRQDTAIAKRLVLVVLTDCLCWFPITVMGLAARSGQPVPGEMYVVATVFLLPANSAFNPFLYTANAILLARRIRKKKHYFEMEIGLRQMS